jgi:hypothetical protein
MESTMAMDTHTTAPNRYVEAMEQRMKDIIPSWHAMDLRLMLSRYQTDGAVASASDLARLTTLLGHAPQSYRAFAVDAAAQWAGG